jgi:hypothetical protein
MAHPEPQPSDPGAHAAESLGTSLRDLPPEASSLSAAAAHVGVRLGDLRCEGVLELGFPVLPWDAWRVLHHLAREPLVFNRDGSLPVRWLRPLEGRWIPVPAWFGIAPDGEVRARAALGLLLELGFASGSPAAPGRNGAVRRSGVSTRGMELLRQGRRSFFAAMVDHPEITRWDPARDAPGERVFERLRMVHWTVGVPEMDYAGLGPRLAPRLLGILPPAGAVRMRDMDQAFAPSDPHVPDPALPWNERRLETTVDQLLERIPRADALALLSGSLSWPCALGLLARGIDGEGNTTWSLTGSGRRWLGLPPSTSSPPPRHARITPAFDLFFGRPDPQALAEASLYCALTGADHGVVGRLTRPSVQSALALGISVAEIAESLESLSANVLPPNVRTVLGDWERGAQPVRVREGILLECPDEATATTLARLAGAAADRVEGRALFLSDRKALNALRRRATESGIFL